MVSRFPGELSKLHSPATSYIACLVDAATEPQGLASAGMNDPPPAVQFAARWRTSQARPLIASRPPLAPLGTRDPRRITTLGSRHPRKSRIKNSIQIGKYLVSPLIKRLADGRFAPSVSIRSGRGSATHDRVMRLVRVFDTHRAARRHAVEQGLLALGMPAALSHTQP